MKKQELLTDEFLSQFTDGKDLNDFWRVNLTATWTMEKTRDPTTPTPGKMLLLNLL